MFPRHKFRQALRHNVYIYSVSLYSIFYVKAPVLLIALCCLVANPFSIHFVWMLFFFFFNRTRNSGWAPTVYILIFGQFEEPGKTFREKKREVQFKTAYGFDLNFYINIKVWFGWWIVQYKNKINITIYKNDWKKHRKTN